MNKRNVFILGFLFFLGQNTEAQILEKGIVKSKAVYFSSKEGEKEANLLFDSILQKLVQIIDKSKITEEKKSAIKEEILKNKEETLSNLSKEMVVKDDFNYSYSIKFSPTEVLREKFDFKDSKLKHQQIYADGRIVNYDFWTNKSKLTYLNEDNLHVLPQPIIVKIDKNDKKTILNYLCYKVRIEEDMPADEDEAAQGEELESEDEAALINTINKEMSNFLKAKVIYEMYVTEDIKLFPHALLDLTNPIQGYFPLEVVEYVNRLPNFRKKTTVVSIQ